MMMMMLKLKPRVVGASTNVNAKSGVGDGHLFNLRFLIALLLFLPLPKGTNGENLKLTILHSCDIHARFNQTDKFGGVCTDELDKEEKCFGGFPRMYHKVKEIRSQEKNVLFFYNGDYFGGTVFYNVHKWKVVSDLANLLNYTALVLGNHEFDHKWENLVPFIKNGNFPVVATNIQERDEPRFVKLKKSGRIVKSLVMKVSGVKIGIVGYTLGKDVTFKGNLLFRGVLDEARDEASKLKLMEGAKIVIAVGHADLDTDVQLAEEAPYIDVIVGSHGNSFMYNGEPPSAPEKAMFPYPIMVKRMRGNGTDVPVANVYPWGKYLGRMDLVFNEAGHLTEVTPGNPILLDKMVPQDEDMLKRISIKWRVDDAFSMKVGSTSVVLNGKQLVCQQRECNIGNLITDAIVFGAQKFKVHMALMYVGGIRDSINTGDIILSQLYHVLPLGDTYDLVELLGSDLKKVLEHSVGRYKPDNTKKTPEFLQMSRIRVLYDVSQPKGSRVQSIRVYCHSCKVPGYVQMENDTSYKIAMPTHIVNGEYGYMDLANETISIPEIAILDALLEYLSEDINKPVKIGIEGRICFVTEKDCNHNGGSTLAGRLQVLLIAGVVLDQLRYVLL